MQLPDPARLAICLLVVALQGPRGDPLQGPRGGSLQEREVRCPEPVEVETLGTPFSWRAEPQLAGTARLLAGEAASRAPLPGIGDPTGVLPAPPTIWVLEELDCLARHGLSGTQPDWVAGVASSAGGFVALRAGGDRGLPSLRSVLRHELAHLALAAVTEDRAPRWLHEGYAQYASGSWDWREAWRLRFVLLVDRDDLLSSLSSSFPRDPERARIAYLLSYTAVRELAALAGEGALAAFFEALGRGEGTDGSLRLVYGLTLDRFEERWRERVKARYGWLYLLSRISVFWLALTLLLVWVGRRRRLHNRRRMEALREAERGEEARGEHAEPWREGGWRPGRPPRGLP